MWIPVVRLSAVHSTDEIVQSLAGDSQPAIWQAHRASLLDFVRSPHQKISFLYRSGAALHSWGGLALQVCGLTVRIRNISKYDKLYFVDLTRLPGDFPDRDIYNWFVNRISRPVLITLTFVAYELKSQSHKPCFVQHRLRKLNRVKTPSLRRVATSQKIPLDDIDDAAVKIDDSGPPIARFGSVANETTSPQFCRGERANAAIGSSFGRVITQDAGPVCKPTGLMPCLLADVPNDLSALKYLTMVDVYNTYEVLTDSGFDETHPPDVDIAVYEGQFNSVDEVTEDFELVSRFATHALMGFRTLKPKRQQLLA
uniref:Uncharacterized protein n=1 Tax=Peronospora matthiolae TaxID=2874970 RepID=A0AAV1UBG5_9STRA